MFLFCKGRLNKNKITKTSSKVGLNNTSFPLSYCGAKMLLLFLQTKRFKDFLVQFKNEESLHVAWPSAVKRISADQRVLQIESRESGHMFFF